MDTQSNVAIVFLWIARVLAGLLILFWGAFFVEHLVEWFFRDDGRLPHAKVWVGQALHLAMLLSLVLLVFRPAPGAVATVIATVAFFGWIGVYEIPSLALLNLLPIAAVAIYLVLRPRENQPLD